MTTRSSAPAASGALGAVSADPMEGKRRRTTARRRAQSTRRTAVKAPCSASASGAAATIAKSGTCRTDVSPRWANTRMSPTSTALSRLRPQANAGNRRSSISSSGRKSRWWKFGGNHSIVELMNGTLFTTSSGNRIARMPNGFARLATADPSPRSAVSPTTRQPARRRARSRSNGTAVPSPMTAISTPAIMKPAWRFTHTSTRAGTSASVRRRCSQPGRRSHARTATKRYVNVWGRACQNPAPVQAARRLTAAARSGWTPRARIVTRITANVATTMTVLRPIRASRPPCSHRSVNSTCVPHMWLIHGRPSAV